MKLLFILLISLFSSCSALFVSSTYEFRFNAYSFTPVPTSIYPSFTPVSTVIGFPSPTRELYFTITPIPTYIFLTSTPSPIPTIGNCGGIVVDSLIKRKLPSSSSSIMGSLRRGDIALFTEYSSDRLWLHLIDLTWIKIRDGNVLYVDIGAC